VAGEYVRVRLFGAGCALAGTGGLASTDGMHDQCDTIAIPGGGQTLSLEWFGGMGS